MNAIENVILQNYLQAKAILSAMEAEFAQLPKGNLTYRQKGPYHYCHLQFRDADKKVHNQRIAEADIESTQLVLDRRDSLKQDIQQLQQYIKILEKNFPQSCSPDTTDFSGSAYMAPDPGKPFLTLKGEYVRSKSELIIANELYMNQIPYEYEKELFLNGWTYPVRPDFTICTPKGNRIIYWEHCGLMSNEEYESKWERKKQAYKRTGISLQNQNLIVTYEYQGNDLDLHDVRQHIAHLKRL